MNGLKRLTTLMPLVFLLAAASITSHAQTSANENKTFIGVVDCGKWLTARKNNSGYFEVWVNGYLSGINLMSGKGNDFLAKIKSTNQIHTWIDNFCQQNPLKNVDEAAFALAIELIATQ
jgi:hypothetical protein